MKRCKKIITCFLCLVFMLNGCSIAGNKNTAIDKKHDQKTELKLWYYWDVSDNQLKLSKLIKDFNDSQDKIEVKPVYIPDEDFKKQLSLSVITKKSPDLVLIDSVDHKYYANMDMFVNLKGKIDDLDLYSEESLNSCRVNDNIYGVPFGVNCLALFYNEDMLRDAGCTVPTNWKEFRETAKKLTNKQTYGFAITALESEESLYEFLPILWSNGGDVSNIASKGGKESFSLLRNLIEDGSMSKASTNLTMQDLAQEFMDKKIAMMFNSSMVVETIRKNSQDLSWDIAEIPSNDQHVSVIGGENWAALKGRHQNDAIKFLKYVTAKEKLQSYISDFGFLSARKDIRDTQYKGDAVMQKFCDIYQQARQREMSPEWPHISAVIANTMNKTIMDEENLDEIINKSKTNIDNILIKDKSNEKKK